nr:putative inorganic phosphate transporter 1-8 [Quercus suber]
MVLKFLYVLDTAKTQLYHFNAIIIAGTGLFPDAYDLFCIPLIMILNGRLYYEKEAGPKKYVIPPVVVFTMVVITLVGTAIGQRVLGRLGYLIGRRRLYGFALIIMVLSSIACGFSKCSTRNCVLGFEILAALAVTIMVCAILDRASDGAPKDPTPKETDLHGR